MSKTATMKQKYSHKHWLSFGITEQDWTALAYLVNATDKKGIKFHNLYKPNASNGLEALFEGYGAHPILLSVATTGNSRVEFYRHWDKGPEYVRSCGDIKENWEAISRLICNLR
jgi:hypothetical protein